MLSVPMLLSLLAGCATPSTVLQPVAVPCPFLQVSPEVLEPARRQALHNLESWLNSQPTFTPKPPPTPISSTPL